MESRRSFPPNCLIFPLVAIKIAKIKKSNLKKLVVFLFLGSIRGLISLLSFFWKTMEWNIVQVFHHTSFESWLTAGTTPLKYVTLLHIFTIKPVMSSLQMKSIAFVTFPYSHKLKTSLTSNLIWAELSVYDHLKVNEELEKYSAHITGVPFYVVCHKASFLT
jgi:hypothetical protein